jgi:hypothetical protein
MRILLSLTVGFALSAAAFAQPDSLPNWVDRVELLPQDYTWQHGHSYLGRPDVGDDLPCFMTSWPPDSAVILWRQVAPFEFEPDTILGLPSLNFTQARFAPSPTGHAWYFGGEQTSGRIFRKDNLLSNDPAMEVLNFGTDLSDFQILMNNGVLECYGFTQKMLRWTIPNGVAVEPHDTIASLFYHFNSHVMDLNYDGHPDILTAAQYAKFFLNDGNQGWTEHPISGNINHITFGNFDNDLDLDFAHSSSGGDNWGYMSNELNGVFEEHGDTFPASLWAGKPLVEDINFDGLDDILFHTGNSGWPNTVIWRQGIDNLDEPLNFQTLLGRDLIDFDLDGDFDTFDIQYSRIVVRENLQILEGCVYESAINFNSEANVDDGSCVFLDVMCPGDQDGDNFVSISDLLMILSVFGSGCP